MINFKPLWKMLIDRELTKGDLKELAGISASSIARMGANENVTIDIIDKICQALECQPGDLMEYVDQPQPKNFKLKSRAKLSKSRSDKKK